MTFMQNQPEVNPDCIGLYGTALAAPTWSTPAVLNERGEMYRSVVGPGDCERQFRFVPF